MSVKRFGRVAGLCLAVGILVPVAHAGSLHQLTKLTFNGPVQIPGNIVLPGGTYWFEIPDAAQPNTVVIYNSTRTKAGAIESTRVAFKPTATSKTELIFAEGTSRDAIALEKWFYPGTDYGHAFVYSPRTVRRLQEEHAQIVIGRAQNSASITPGDGE